MSKTTIVMELNKIYNGNCLEVLKTFEDNSIDSCVTDPPYGISFMNKHWDYELPSIEVWKELLRVLKPGGHLLCACGTRTQHRMAVNIEDAGFEIRDVITWHYGSGFPKSLDVSKAIDKQAGAEREIIGVKKHPTSKDRTGNKSPYQNEDHLNANSSITAPSTEAAKQWEGWGTALKPATEFWTLCRKPLEKSTISDNVLNHGTGGINIDGCRIGETTRTNKGKSNSENNRIGAVNGYTTGIESKVHDYGRFPANLILDEFCGNILDEQSGNVPGGMNKTQATSIFGSEVNDRIQIKRDCDEGGASRFFYCPKPDNYERDKGLKELESKIIKGRDDGQDKTRVPYKLTPTIRKNIHPTVKPIDLMRYLVKLITPKGGIVLDPFIGSGTTGIGAKLELINYIGIERELEYCKIAEARIAAWNPEKYKPQTLFQGE